MKKRNNLSHTFWAGMLALAMVIGMVPGTVAEAGNVNKEGKAAAKAALNLDEGAEYHAYILFSVQHSWVYRGRFFEKDNGLSYKYWNNLVTSLDLAEAEPVDGKIQDAVISGNGHYTVKITDLNGSPSVGANNAELGIVGFTTDFPKNDKIKFDNVKVTIDGVDKGTVTGDQVYYDKDDIVDPGLITVEVLNAWHPECKGLNLTLPEDSLEISFDVSGFNFDNPDAVEKTNIEQKDNKTDTQNTDNNAKKSNNSSMVVVVVIVGIAVVAVVIGYTVRKRKK